MNLLTCVPKSLYYFCPFLCLAITSTLGLHAFLINIHHNTSFWLIFEDGSISFTYRTCICFCSSKGPTGLWLIARPFICLFHITHSTFTLTMHFRLDLIQPLTFSVVMCECEYRLNTSSMHLAHCLFRGQQIATHVVIIDVMYAFIQKWACCMEKMVVHHYIKSFITSQSLHDSWELGFYCQCGG